MLGTLSAIAHGFVFPAALFVLGNMVDLFVMHEATRIVAKSAALIPVDFISNTITDTNRIEQGRFCNFDSESICTTDSGSSCVNASFGSASAGARAGVSFVNCSTAFSIQLPHPYLITVELSITDVLRNCLFAHARCLDDEDFTSEISLFIYGLLAVSVAATLLGSLQVLFFQTVCERQVQKMKLHYYRALLRQELGWFDRHQAGDLCSKFSE